MKKQILAILAAFACALAEAEVVARVVTNKAGVPQIRVNGEVVRPRMFWGWRGDVLYDQVRLAASNGVDFVSFMAEKSAWRGSVRQHHERRRAEPADGESAADQAVHRYRTPDR